MKTIMIDGSEGEGGGQIVRSSLALAAVTGVPVKLVNIRGGRKKPGLLRQHLAGVKAITTISHAETDGAELGSRCLTVSPKTLCGGEYTFEVGSAGSAILVAQTILPALLFADKESTVTIHGGTHAAWAPPYDFFARCYLPLLERMNGKVEVSIESYGFYPAGGGKIVMRVQPSSSLNGLSLMERQGGLQPRVHALVAKIPGSVGERECHVIRRKTGWDESVCEVSRISQSGGPGNVVMIECGFDNLAELVIGFGKVGVRAEHVARSVLRDARAYLASDVPVGPFLADQLLLPMGLAADAGQSSEFRTSPLSQHSLTHIDILQRFLNIEIRCCENEDGSVSVGVG